MSPRRVPSASRPRSLAGLPCAAQVPRSLAARLLSHRSGSPRVQAAAPGFLKARAAGTLLRSGNAAEATETHAAHSGAGGGLGLGLLAGPGGLLPGWPPKQPGASSNEARGRPRGGCPRRLVQRRALQVDAHEATTARRSLMTPGGRAARVFAPLLPGPNGLWPISS